MPEENSLYAVCINIILSCVSLHITSIKLAVSIKSVISRMATWFKKLQHTLDKKRGGWLQLLCNVQLGTVTGAWHGPQKTRLDGNVSPPLLRLLHNCLEYNLGIWEDTHKPFAHLRMFHPSSPNESPGAEALYSNVQSED